MRACASKLLAAALLLAACEAASNDPAAKPLRPLRAGTGAASIDLPVGHSTAGYAQSSVLAYKFPKDEPGSAFAELFPATRGVQSLPAAKAVLLDNGQTVFAVVKIDAIFTTDVLVNRAVELARERLGLDLGGRLLVSATHTHDAGCRFATSMVVKLLENERGWRQDAVGHGVDAFNPESLNRVAGSIVDALAAAQANMKPAALGYARMDVAGANHDRRCQDDALYGADKIDRALRLLRIDEVDEATGESVAPLAVLVNFAMHGTIYGSNNRNFSVDAPGFVEYKLAERFEKPVNVLYLQGAAGDVSPGGEGDGSQRMEDVGYRVADAAYRLYAAVTGAAEADFTLPLTRALPMTIKTRRIPLRHDLMYEKNEFFSDGAILCAVGVNDSCPEPGPNGEPRDVQPISTEGGGRCVGVALEGQGKYHTDLMAVRLGELTIATLPGEPVTEIERRVLAASATEGFGETLVLGYAQDHNGYILMPDDWLRGGYEPTISYWGWNFAPYLLEQQADLLHELATGAAAKKHRAPKVTYPDVTTPPVPAAPGRVAPAVQTGAAPAYRRFDAVTVAWTGGDPALGLPRVTVERKQGGAWAPLRWNGWRAVDNTAYEVQTFYAADPSYATFQFRRDVVGEDIRWGEGAWVPDHRWSARWEIPAWAPAGAYRLRVTGATVASLGGDPRAYDLATAAFQVEPAPLATANACDADGDGALDATQDFFTVVTGATGLDVAVTAFFPQAKPAWERAFNDGGWQIGNYRLWSARGTADYPVAGALRGKVTLKKDGAAVATAELTWRDVAGTGKLAPACPGDGVPRATASFAWAGPGSYEVSFAAGDVADAYGNPVTAAAAGPFVR